MGSTIIQSAETFPEENFILDLRTTNNLNRNRSYDIIITNKTAHSDITTPTNSKANKELNTLEHQEEINTDETPSKSFPLPKRKSLMQDMQWEEKTSTEEESSKTKHPMEMRSRKRLKLSSPYYDYQEYDDFAEDLSFLFDEQLPDLEFRPRRTKSRKRKSFKLESSRTDRKDINSSTSRISQSESSDAKKTTSNDDFSTIRPNGKLSPLFKRDLMHCNNSETSKLKTNLCPNDFETVMDLTTKINCNNQTSDVSMKNKNSSKRKRKYQKDSLEIEEKSSKKHRNHNNEIRLKTSVGVNDSKLVSEEPNDSQKKPKIEKLFRVSCVIRKLDVNQANFIRFKGIHCEDKKVDHTVTRMNLRRRHSSPIFSDFHEKNATSLKKKLQRTISSASACSPTNMEEEKVSAETQGQSEDVDFCDDVSDSDQFVDSPDSGFGSESSCSAASPGGGPSNGFFYSPSKSADNKSEADGEVTKVDYDPIKDLITRTTSTDSGIQLSDDASLLHHNRALMTKQSEKEAEDESRLVLCQKSVREAQKLEEEAKKKEEEATQREKYRCHWLGCPAPYQNLSVSDLHDHLQKFHAVKKKSEKYFCRWQGCKMFNVQCRKLAWIQRHIGEHSGQKPYKCIIEGCGASFSSTSSWKRHVEGHYSEVTLPKARVGGDHGVFSRFLLNSRRVQNKKKALANRHDCMDNRTLSFIKGALIQNEIVTATDSVGCSSDVVLEPEVLGKKTESDGSKSVLVRWHPVDLLPDEWIKESEAQEQRRIRRSSLPWSAKSYLKKLFSFGVKPTGRKAKIVEKPSLFGKII